MRYLNKKKRKKRSYFVNVSKDEEEGISSPPVPPVEEPKKRTRFSDTIEEKEFSPQESVMPETAEPDDWNWFTSLRSKIEQSNTDFKNKINKSNKKIV